MQHDQQVRLMKQLIERLDAGTNVDAGGMVHNPTAAYTDPQIAEQEWDVFFRNHTQLLGLSADLPTNGSFFTNNDLGSPIIATRTENGEFKAFLNVCRHRGVVVESRSRGEARAFTCPFHGWTYSNEGELIGLPKPEHFGQLDRSCHGLVELPTEERHSLLWVHPNPDGAVDIGAQLGDDLNAEFESWDFTSLQLLTTDTYDMPLNWKLAMDTFGETYHFPVLHRDTLAMSFHGNVQCYDTFGRNHRMILCRRDIDDIRHLPEEEWQLRSAALPVYYLFPNIQLMPSEEGLFLVRAYPVAGEPGRHISQVSFYTERDCVDVPVAEMRANSFAAVIRDEDYAAAASSQFSAGSPGIDHVVFGRNEPALHHYHNTYREALGMDPLPLIPA